MAAAPAQDRGRLHAVVLGTADSIAGTVYGTIVVMGSITAGAEGTRDPVRLAVIVASTVLVLWLAHVYAHGLGESVARQRRLDRAELLSVARREFSIPLAAAAPTAALVLGGLDIVGDATAAWLALGIGLATLAVQGGRYAMLEHLGPPATAAIIAVNVGLGLVIVALKVFIAH